jgi:hypothetical protein
MIGHDCWVVPQTAERVPEVGHAAGDARAGLAPINNESAPTIIPARRPIGLSARRSIRFPSLTCRQGDAAGVE